MHKAWLAISRALFCFELILTATLRFRGTVESIRGYPAFAARL
jgi:hypothetical protein